MTVHVPIDGQQLVGELSCPVGVLGVVLFAHGSGSSRLSPRNQFVARTLEQRGLATLLIDLLTSREESLDVRSGEFRFDIALLAKRLIAIIDWFHHRDELRTLPVGLFGASTGGGAALVSAAICPDAVQAIVSRGGRPDLAGAALKEVTAPTLLIVGGLDTSVLEMNRDAMRQMRCEVRLEIVPGATHLFEEPGTLQQVASLAGGWFETHLHEPTTLQPEDTDPEPAA